MTRPTDPARWEEWRQKERERGRRFYREHIRDDPERMQRQRDFSRKWHAANAAYLVAENRRRYNENPEVYRERRREYKKRQAPEVRERRLEDHRARSRRRIRLGGEAYLIDKLPPELRPVAELIRETRLELRKRHG